jgi:uncharacterized protein GlcG (DUF336 family)
MNAMKRLGAIGAACALAGWLAAAANAQLLTHKDLSAAMALTMAQTAISTCTANGYRVSVTVVGRSGEVVLQVRGDGTGPHTMENSLRKAYTSRTFSVPSGEIVKRWKDNPQYGAVFLSNIAAAQGGLPIRVGDDTIGGIGVSGSPGGDKDEVCAKAAIDKVADELK